MFFENSQQIATVLFIYLFIYFYDEQSLEEWKILKNNSRQFLDMDRNGDKNKHLVYLSRNGISIRAWWSWGREWNSSHFIPT